MRIHLLRATVLSAIDSYRDRHCQNDHGKRLRADVIKQCVAEGTIEGILVLVSALLACNSTSLKECVLEKLANTAGLYEDSDLTLMKRNDDFPNVAELMARWNSFNGKTDRKPAIGNLINHLLRARLGESYVGFFESFVKILNSNDMPFLYPAFTARFVDGNEMQVVKTETKASSSAVSAGTETVTKTSSPLFSYASIAAAPTSTLVPTATASIAPKATNT